jgi:hypothetical protein
MTEEAALKAGSGAVYQWEHLTAARARTERISGPDDLHLALEPAAEQEITDLTELRAGGRAACGRLISTPALSAASPPREYWRGTVEPRLVRANDLDFDQDNRGVIPEPGGQRQAVETGPGTRDARSLALSSPLE